MVPELVGRVTPDCAQRDVGVFGVDYRRTNGAAYRTDRDFNADVRFREGTALFIDVDRSRFEGTNDHQTALRLARPNGDPYRRQMIEYAWGRLAGLVLALSDDPNSTRVWAKGSGGEGKVAEFLVPMSAADRAAEDAVPKADIAQRRLLMRLIRT